MTANHLKDKVRLCISSVQFSCSVVSDSLQPYELQHARPPCPSPTPRAYSNSCPLSQWCHPTSVVPFSSRLQSFPASGSFQMSHPLLLLPSIRVFSNESALCIRSPKYWSFSFSISPSNEPPGLISFRMDWLDLLAVQGTLKSLLQHHSWKASIFRCSAKILNLGRFCQIFLKISPCQFILPRTMYAKAFFTIANLELGIA